MKKKLKLPDVSLLAIAHKKDVDQTQISMKISSENIAFGAIKLLTSAQPKIKYPDIEYVPIKPMMNLDEYSKSMIEDLREIGRSIIIAALILIILQLLIQNYVVKGKSMFPNLEDGQRVLVNKFIYQRTIDFDKDYVGQGKEFIFDGPQRDEIVVFKSPHNYQKEALVKRIIGLPGDWVEIKDGVVLVNNNPLSNDFGFTSSISFEKLIHSKK